MISKENKYDNEKESSDVKVIKLISLTLGISLILTTFTAILYQDLKPMFKNIIAFLDKNVRISSSLITPLSWILALGIIVIIAYYWGSAIHKLVSNPLKSSIISIIHIILALLFVFVDLGGFVDFITAKTVTAKEVWTIFVFMLFVVFSVLRILKAIIEWLKKDGTSNKSIPRTTVLLTLLGTILGLLLKKYITVIILFLVKIRIWRVFK